MKTTYQEIEIEYNEQDNNWVFTLRGRERKCESLAKAKEAIGRPAKSDDKPTFTRRPAFLKRYGNIPEPCEVTSIADTSTYQRGVYYWIVKKSDKLRSKEPEANLIADTAENLCRIHDLEALDKQINELVEARRSIESKLTPLK